jgi:transcriptional regulator of acetoin/glycerol metabolism/AraC-like DNA-binding protein
MGAVLDPSHSDAVVAALEGAPIGWEAEAVSHSWKRSAQLHRLDPDSHESPHILPESALRCSREPMESAIRAAEPELDRLHRIVGEAGYVTLLCDASGVAVAHRGKEQLSSEFRHWGIWLGGVWSEAVEGTNGIGTCIAEHRPVTVHQTQHFRTRHIGLSCSGAPVFDGDARIVAVLDISAMSPTLPAQTLPLTLPLVVNTARLIEERLFRERFPREWIIVVASSAAHPASLLAVDREQRLIGADRYARRRFNLDQRALDSGMSLWTTVARSGALFQRGASSDYPVRLTSVQSNETLFALVSPPVTGSRLYMGRVDLTLRMQPRLALVEDLQRHFELESPRGGLAPGALRRVKEHIGAHLGENLTIERLAAQTGLSLHHFARAFKASIGLPPHRYLLEQRIQKAAELLQSTEQAIATIALSVGFADQSHFSNSFHQLAGVTPAQFRRAHR